MPSVSVIIPTHNRKHLVGRALDSVLAQTLKVNQIIVVDDGSTDGTADWIQQNYPKVVLLQQHHAGVSTARNRGIAVADGEWITLLDSDDEWLPLKIETQLQAVQGSPQIKISHTDEIWIRHGKRINQMKKHSKPDGWIFNNCLPLCCVSPSSVMLHASLFETGYLFDESLPACEDYDLWLRLCSRYPVKLSATPLLLKYGGHADQLSQKYWGLDRFRVRALLKLLHHTELTAAQRKMTVSMLLQKLDILINGSRKRGRHAEVEHYLTIKQRFQSC